MAPPTAPAPLSNAEIAHHLTALAQLLSAQNENPFKIRAYRRAADTIRNLGESIDALVRRDVDLTQFSGIGKAIAGAIREIVLSGALRQLQTLRASAPPELAALSDFPRLDPKRVLRIYKALGISSVAELRAALDSGALAKKLGPRLEHHVRSALTDADEILLFDAHEIVANVRSYLLTHAGATRVEPTGDYRRRVETLRELTFLVQTPDFPALVSALKNFGGRTAILRADATRATFKLSSGLLLTVEHAPAAKWGLALLLSTGSESHLEKLAPRGLAKLARSRAALTTEKSAYRALRLAYIEPELREGHDEVARAAKSPKKLPPLVTLADIRGELHCHSTSSDGAHTIEQLAVAARKRRYAYLGITDHSQSLKIAGGVSIADLRAQIRAIDKLNSRLSDLRILKSAEVDILADGSLDYPDDLLAELDYTVCSIHSRFALNKAQQTERLLRAMDNPHCNILGHATGRLLLRRPGYEIDIDRVIEHARQRGCFFEINSSPDRLDLRVEHARLARDAGLKIAINTDAHSIAEFDFLPAGIDQARRAGLTKSDVLNCLPLEKLLRALKR